MEFTGTDVTHQTKTYLLKKVRLIGTTLVILEIGGDKHFRDILKGKSNVQKALNGS